MEIKFNYYNKKVVVLEMLNDSQAICQAVNNGAPEGPKFVENISELTDIPREILKDEESLKKLKARLVTDIETYRNRIRCYENDVDKEYQQLKDLRNWLKRIAKEPQHEKVKEMIRLMYCLISPEQIWAVSINKWSKEFNIFEWDRIKDFHFDDYNHEPRLIALYPPERDSFAPHTVNFYLNGYSDGSGSNKYAISLFSTYKDAKAYVQKFVDNLSVENINMGVLKLCKKFDIAIPLSLLEQYEQKQKKAHEEDDAIRKKQDLERKSSIKKTYDFINELKQHAK